MFFQNINYIVVVVAAVFGMAVGFSWYSPWAFGKLWMTAKGRTKEAIDAEKAARPVAAVWAASALFALVTAFILAALFNSLVVTSLSGMIAVAFSVWIGFVVPVKLGDVLFGGESTAAFLISIGHELAAILVMALIVGIWG